MNEKTHLLVINRLYILFNSFLKEHMKVFGLVDFTIQYHFIEKIKQHILLYKILLEKK